MGIDTEKIEAYLKYLAKQMSILHGVILFDDDKEYAKEKSIENTNELYGVLNPDAVLGEDLVATALNKMNFLDLIKKEKENE